MERVLLKWWHILNLSDQKYRLEATVMTFQYLFVSATLVFLYHMIYFGPFNWTIRWYICMQLRSTICHIYLDFWSIPLAFFCFRANQRCRGWTTQRGSEADAWLCNRFVLFSQNCCKVSMSDKVIIIGTKALLTDGSWPPRLWLRETKSKFFLREDNAINTI